MSQRTPLCQDTWIVTRLLVKRGLICTYVLQKIGGVEIHISTNELLNQGSRVRLLSVNSIKDGRICRSGIEIVWSDKKKGLKGPSPARITNGHI